MTPFETYSDHISYVVILIAFLTPFVLIVNIYVWYKTRELKTKSIIWSAVYIIMTLAAYLYLNPIQRLYCLMYTVSVIVVVIGVTYIANLFRR